MAKTIEDYKKDYEAARARGDAAGMQAANDGANAIRAATGQTPQYATEDIIKTAGYTPINSYSAVDINRDNYQKEVLKQQQYVAANPTATQAMSAEEKQAKYGDIISSTVPTGYYTQDARAAQAAADKYGVAVTPTSYNDQEGWYLVDKAQRTVQAGTSGADEGLLSDYDYAIVQALKQDFADAQSKHKEAVKAGDTVLAARYQQAMEAAHLEAERIRAGYGYSGGQDGSMYITSGALGTAGGSAGGGGAVYGAASGSSGSYGGSVGSGSSVGSGGSVVPSVPSVSAPPSVPGLSASLTAHVENLSPYLEQMHAAQREAALAQLNAAYESNVSALDRAQAGLGEQYQAARSQTAGASELAKRSFNEYAAASGLNSGAGGQAELARNVTLQNNLNAINTAQADAVADLQLQRASAETEYNLAIAQAEAAGDYELAAALYQEKVRVQEALTELEIRQHQFDLQQYQLQYQAHRDTVGDQQYAADLAFQQQQHADNLALKRQQYAGDLALKQQQYADSLAFQQQQYADSLALQQQQAAVSAAQSRQDTLAEYGSAYLKMGIMPSAAMLSAMGITEADAQRYITALGK